MAFLGLDVQTQGPDRRSGRQHIARAGSRRYREKCFTLHRLIRRA